MSSFVHQLPTLLKTNKHVENIGFKLGSKSYCCRFCTSIYLLFCKGVSMSPAYFICKSPDKWKENIWTNINVRLRYSKGKNNKYKHKMGLINPAGIECKLLQKNSMFFSGNQLPVKIQIVQQSEYWRELQ